MSPRGQSEGGGPCGLRGIWASWNVKETEPRAPSPQSKPLSKAVEKLLASRREGSMLPNSVYNALEAWLAGPQRSSCGKNGRQLLWQGSREGSSLPTTAGPEEGKVSGKTIKGPRGQWSHLSSRSFTQVKKHPVLN